MSNLPFLAYPTATGVNCPIFWNRIFLGFAANQYNCSAPKVAAYFHGTLNGAKEGSGLARQGQVLGWQDHRHHRPRWPPRWPRRKKKNAATIQGPIRPPKRLHFWITLQCEKMFWNHSQKPWQEFQSEFTQPITTYIWDFWKQINWWFISFSVQEQYFRPKPS